MRRPSIAASMRRAVRQRAGGSCEYCLVNEEDTPVTHPIDHIIAVKHGGATTFENLALACIECNLHKGSDIASLDPVAGTLVPLFHPCEQSWSEHFRLEGVRIVGRTAIGRATSRLLQMNSSSRLIHRSLLRQIGRYPRD